MCLCQYAQAYVTAAAQKSIPQKHNGRVNKSFKYLFFILDDKCSFCSPYVCQRKIWLAGFYSTCLPAQNKGYLTSGFYFIPLFTFYQHPHFIFFLPFRRLHFLFTTLLCVCDGSSALSVFVLSCRLQNNDQLALLFHCHSLTCGVEIEKVVVHFLSDNVTKIDLEAVNRRTRTKCQA